MTSDPAPPDGSADGPGGPAGGAAYGLRLTDLPGASRYLRRPEGGERPWTVRRVLDPAVTAGQEDVVGPDEARHPLADGGLAVVDRRSSTTTLRTANPVSDAEVVHPYLASTAVLAAHWQGRLALHAGAVLLPDPSVVGAVVAVLGARDAGKSTTTWALSIAGCPLVTDDVLVLDPGEGPGPHGWRVWPGPACVDLRAGAAQHFAAGEALGVVGRRERWRAAPPGADLPARLHLSAVVEPVWGPRAVERVPVAERLTLLTGALALRLPPTRPDALLRLAALPFLRWRRPREFAALPEALADLLTALRG